MYGSAGGRHKAFYSRSASRKARYDGRAWSRRRKPTSTTDGALRTDAAAPRSAAAAIARAHAAGSRSSRALGEGGGR